MNPERITVFTKPWTEPLPGLADKLARLGVAGVELPVRAGWQVPPDADVAAGLRRAVRDFAAAGLAIDSIASEARADIVAACGEAGVPLIRIMAPIDRRLGYAASVDALRRRLDALLPQLERSGVCIGVQNHSGHYVGSAVGLMQLLAPYDPARVCAVFDMAHCALAGEPTDLAVDIARTHITRLVNFKSGHLRRQNGPGEPTRWRVHWGTHADAAYAWADYVQALRAIGYRGAYNLPAEYSDAAGGGHCQGDAVLPQLAEDLAQLRALLAARPAPPTPATPAH